MQADQTTVVKTIVWVGIVLFVALLVSGIVVNSAISKKLDSIDYPVLPTDAEFAKMIEDEVGKIVLPEMSEFPEYMISEDEYDEAQWEAEIEKLALAELDERDFKNDLKDAINGDDWWVDGIEDIIVNGPILSYKDITDVKIKDVDVDGVIEDSETAEVEVELKVYFFIDDEEDEEYRSRVIVTFNVTGLDLEDNDYSDAEATYNFEVQNVYEQ